MVKKLSKTLLLMMAAMLALSCSSNEDKTIDGEGIVRNIDTESGTIEDADIVGVWTAHYVNPAANMLAGHYVFLFNQDQTGLQTFVPEGAELMDLDMHDQHFTYEIKGDTITLDYDPSESEGGRTHYEYMVSELSKNRMVWIDITNYEWANNGDIKYIFER